MNREIRTEVKTYKVDMSCLKCDGIMRATGTSFLTFPQQFEHECIKCGNKENFVEVYPTTKYE